MEKGLPDGGTARCGSSWCVTEGRGKHRELGGGRIQWEARPFRLGLGPLKCLGKDLGP